MVPGRCQDGAGVVMAWLVLTQHQPKREEPMCLETSLCDVSRFAFILFVLVVSIHINMVMCLLTCVSQRSMYMCVNYVYGHISERERVHLAVSAGFNCGSWHVKNTVAFRVCIRYTPMHIGCRTHWSVISVSSLLPTHFLNTYYLSIRVS